MSYSAYIKKVYLNKYDDNENCRKWLIDNLRFKLKVPGKQQNIKVHLISHDVHDIETFDNRGKNCDEAVRKALWQIFECYETFEKIAHRIKSDASLDEFQKILSEVNRGRETSTSFVAPNESEKLDSIIDQFINDCLKEEKFEKLLLKKKERNLLQPNAKDLQKILVIKEYREKFADILNKFFDELDREKKAQKDQFFEMLFSEDNREFLMGNFKLTQEELPDEPGDFCLGRYYHSGKINIYLDVIYQAAKRSNLDPYILYIKVLSHELAHAFHHRGFDANSSQWDHFGKSFTGRNELVEGLANWHCLQYMIKLDADGNTYIHQHTLHAFSSLQSAPYQHYRNWIKYSFENIRNRILFARALHPSSLGLDKIEYELNKCHQNGE